MIFRYCLLSLFFICLIATGYSQDKVYNLKKGQAFDILLLTQNPEAKESLGRYFKEVIPIGQEYGYTPQKSLKTDRPPVQGNYWPGVIVVGLWTDYSKRVAFVDDIITRIPDFHERRREIWPTFNLTYWEVKEDMTVTVKADKFNVMTAYWSEDDQKFEKFTNLWKKNVEKQGGEIILDLQKGTSPFGYHYNPDFLTISEWENEAAFKAHLEKTLSSDHTGVQHVNQFVIE